MFGHVVCTSRTHTRAVTPNKLLLWIFPSEHILWAQLLHHQKNDSIFRSHLDGDSGHFALGGEAFPQLACSFLNFLIRMIIV